MVLEHQGWLAWRLYQFLKGLVQDRVTVCSGGSGKAEGSAEALPMANGQNHRQAPKRVRVPNAVFRVGDPEPFPNARNRVGGPDGACRCHPSFVTRESRFLNQAHAGANDDSPLPLDATTRGTLPLKIVKAKL
jgi:hypothetical protein